jgi:pimeloyl-ACP methyl ester carboxylesterase
LRTTTLSPRLIDWQRGGCWFRHRGHRLFVKQAGRGPALLLIHGYPAGSFDWNAIWPELTGRFAVIAPDMLGLGFSDKPASGAYRLQDHAEMHEALIAIAWAALCACDGARPRRWRCLGNARAARGTA